MIGRQFPTRFEFADLGDAPWMFRYREGTTAELVIVINERLSRAGRRAAMNEAEAAAKDKLHEIRRSQHRRGLVLVPAAAAAGLRRAGGAAAAHSGAAAAAGALSVVAVTAVTAGPATHPAHRHHPVARPAASGVPAQASPPVARHRRPSVQAAGPASGLPAGPRGVPVTPSPSPTGTAPPGCIAVPVTGPLPAPVTLPPGSLQGYAARHAGWQIRQLRNLLDPA